LTEPELIQGLRNKSETAFEYLVHEYQHRVYNVVLGLVQQEVEAEDLVQEVFIQVYLHIASFRNESKLSTWIYKIATTKALDNIRKRNTRKRFGQILSIFGGKEQVEIPEFHHPGIALENKEMAAILFRALQQLPETQRTAFILIKTEGLSYEETSTIMQTSVKAVEALMHRAKQQLKKILTTNNEL
jgi:RNA polymerase sigma factor (sigma-70 family)